MRESGRISARVQDMGPTSANPSREPRGGFLSKPTIILLLVVVLVWTVGAWWWLTRFLSGPAW
jgi:hypothetical protein